MILLNASDTAVTERINRLLEQVERRFADELVSDLDCVNDLATHVERYRGKMLRPMLVILAGLACGREVEAAQDDPHVTLATVVEMVHMATLVHDDILDEADLRRRGATINALCGNEAAVMLGDYLISHAYHLCSSIGDPRVARAIAAATNVICEGELLQLTNRRHWRLSTQTYFDIIERKTAALVGVCCRLGATLAGASDARVAALETYGRQVGVAFQIVDDVLDLTGDQDKVGKTLGLDLGKGKLTLPVIHSLAACGDAERTNLLALLDQYAADGALVNGSRPPVLEKITTALERHDAVSFARAEAARRIEQAKAALAQHLPDGPARKLLTTMADTVLSREQ